MDKNIERLFTHRLKYYLKHSGAMFRIRFHLD
jgi:hypothetical protein